MGLMVLHLGVHGVSCNMCEGEGVQTAREEGC